MTNYVKPSRLHVRFWLLLPYLVLATVGVHAADLTIPQPNGAVSNPNYLEYQKTGNTYTWQPVGTTTPPGSGTVSFPSSHTISDATPKVTTTGDLPYQHKGGAGAKVTITRAIDKAKVAAAAASGLAAAAAAKIKPGNPYVTLAEVSCVVLCPFAIEALADWGVNQLLANGDGTFGVAVPDPGAFLSTGYIYNVSGFTSHDPIEACRQFVPTRYYNRVVDVARTSYNDGCRSVDTSGHTQYESGFTLSPSNCAAGNFIVKGACVSERPSVSKPLGDVFDSQIGAYSDPRAWPLHGAVLAAAIFQSGKDIFTDGTSIDITGPNLVPIGTTTSSSPFNVLPGTTTPVPPGHTGPTDSGTQSTTTTTTATNTFNPGTSGTGGSGSSGSGPSMSTGQKTETKTSITNNITNNTSTSVTTNITQTDDAPKEPEKDFCEKNPDSLACAEADTPDGEIPETQIELSYEYESLFGNGSCPTVDAVPFFGQNVQVVDMPKICQQTTDYIQPFVLVSAALIAMAIFAGGVRS